MDAIVVIHVALQVLVWGVLFPIGMVLGLTRSRWHVPLQSVGYLLTIAGYILGATQNGHDYSVAHGPFAYFLLGPILLQFVLGIYLQLRVNVRSLRLYALGLHGVIGKAYPIFAWIQMLASVARLGGYCGEDHIEQCLAHYSMGSSFIAYGIIMAIVFLVGGTWIRRSGQSPDFYDSSVMVVLGIFNTLVMHEGSWTDLSTWDIHDKQHTTMGVMLWTGGILGMLLSRNNKRSVVPSLILIIMGWSMGEHAQHLELSTKIHSVFGRTLVMAGLTRIAEVCYFMPRFKLPPLPELSTDDASSEHTLTDSSQSHGKLGSQDEDDEKADKQAASDAWRHLPPFLYVASGILLISATDDELELASEKKIDHVTYILTMFSFAFLIYAFTVYLIHLYRTTGRSLDDFGSSRSMSPSCSSSPLSILREPRTPGVLGLRLTPTSPSVPSNWRWWPTPHQGDSERGERRPLHVVGVAEDEDEENEKQARASCSRA